MESHTIEDDATIELCDTLRSMDYDRDVLVRAAERLPAAIREDGFWEASRSDHISAIRDLLEIEERPERPRQTFQLWELKRAYYALTGEKLTTPHRAEVRRKLMGVVDHPRSSEPQFTAAELEAIENSLRDAAT